MTTRVGKIAQLPKEIRDQLNQRLENGKQGPEILKWLNDLPETKKLLAEKFDHQPINKQNLSEWRRGGYEEWLRFQERQLRIQRITEEGLCSMRQENRCDDDLFEHAGRIALAEVMADMDSLHELTREDRFKRLRALTADLSRLQNAYNRSRWSALAWTKWNDRFCGPGDYVDSKPARRNSVPQAHKSHENQPPTPAAQDAVKPSQTTSTMGAPVTLQEISQPTAHAASPPLKEAPEPPRKPRNESAEAPGPRVSSEQEASDSLDQHEQNPASKSSGLKPVNFLSWIESKGVEKLTSQTKFLPLPGGEGRGEGERKHTTVQPTLEPKVQSEIQRLDPLADFLRQAAHRKSQMQ
jgi:hypothetical protein